MNIKSAFIRKRNEKFHVYVEYVEEETGKKKQKSYGSYEKKKDAEKHLIEIKSTINNNKFVAPRDITLVERCYKYIDEKKDNFSPYTLRNRQSIIRNQIKPFFEDTKLIDITPNLLQTYVNKIYKKYSLNSAKNSIGFLNALLHEAYRLREIQEDISKFVITPSKKNTSVTNFYTKEEAQLLLEKCLGTNLAIPIYLMLTLGLRFGEAVAVRWCDVELDEGIINIKQTMIYVRGEVTFKSPKTEKSKRRLTAPIELINLLKEEKIRQNKLKLQGILKNELDLICLNKNFRLWKQQTFFKPFKKLLENNNLRYIKLHELRHTNATLMLLSGTNIKTISERLGHTDIKITMNRYSHVLEEMDREASENLSKILFK
ncbi:MULTISPECIES: site-specific integrase [Clostridioides]|uniref:site-specific integrase n=1 Tax=Clostridioides sp. ZZV14-6387 TaxID=2811497 RepID=UPI0007BB028D|nr:site-specific integrase [Clostridioides sp. ZZV14-6387]CZR95382.1 Putative prophage phiRv2 integrase [Clostridioides difficile]CZS11189.1 Putative prophage phiRv2 integrase [Clostridioides difficile]